MTQLDNSRWAGLGLTAAGLALGAALMAGQAMWLASIGPICGHHGIFVAHCPGCYAALGMIISGLALAAAPREATFSVTLAPRRRTGG